MPADKHDGILQIRDLSLAFRTPAGRFKVLRDISLDLGRGRILGLVGASGCGQSTLISTVLRLLPANPTLTTGEILFTCHTLLRNSEAAIRALSGSPTSQGLPN